MPRVKLVVDMSYQPAERARRREIEECRRLNALVCDLVPLFQHEPSQPTVGMLMGEIERRSEPGEVWALANADISFDETVRKVEGGLGRVALAITRREGGRLRANPWLSQDAWLFEPRAPNGPAFLPRPAFSLGQYGCDARLAFELAWRGWHVFNVCESVHVHHHHAHRRVNEKPWVHGPYVFLPPAPLAVALSMRNRMGLR